MTDQDARREAEIRAIVCAWATGPASVPAQALLDQLAPYLRATPDASDLDRAIAVVESWDELNPGFTMSELVAQEFAALRAEVRRAAVEQCAQWHISRAKQCRESADRFLPEDNDDRQQLLSEAVWHYDSAGLLRALAPTAKDKELCKCQLHPKDYCEHGCAANW